MMNWIENLHPVLQALVAGIFTWSVTAAGAAAVFTTKKVNQKVLDSMLGFAAGVMIAAKFEVSKFMLLSSPSMRNSIPVSSFSR